MINENIQDAEIVEQPSEPTNADLLSALNEPTETKTPSNTNSDGWSFDVEPETVTNIEAQIPNTENVTTNTSTGSVTATENKPSVLSKTEINANAKLTVGFIDFTQQNVLRFS